MLAVALPGGLLSGEHLHLLQLDLSQPLLCLLQPRLCHASVVVQQQRAATEDHSRPVPAGRGGGQLDGQISRGS